MINDFKGKTAVLTGAGSGFGLECARIAARRGMNVVLVDIQADALAAAEAEIKALGARTMARRVDVSKPPVMELLAQHVKEEFGAPHFVFNNAGVGAGGLIWENTVKDWEWVLGVNLWGVINGVRGFTPMRICDAITILAVAVTIAVAVSAVTVSVSVAVAIAAAEMRFNSV